MSRGTSKPIDYAPLKTGGRDPYPVEDVLLPMSGTYQNNTLIKAAHVALPLTDEHKFEIFKCSLDPVYFFENYLRIISLDEGIVSFKLYDFQKEMLDCYLNNRFSITLTARQMGKTVVVAGFILWFAIFHEAKDVAILANKGSQAQEVVERIRTMLEYLPFFLQPGCTTYNKTSVQFENRSRIFSASTSSASIRGRSISLLYIDEAAFIHNDLEFYESTYPVISSGQSSRVIMTSTPKGKRGMFYKIYSDSESGNNEYKSLKVSWDRHPNRDTKWKEETIRNTSHSQFAQEYECDFRGSTGTLIPANILETLVFHNPLTESENLEIYENYIPGHKYVAIADSSEGLGLDYSVLTVFDVTKLPYKIVSIYRNNYISPLEYPFIIKSICEKYGDCPVLVEANNSCGAQVSNALYYDLEYEGTILTSVDIRGQGAKAGGMKRAIPGVKTSVRVKAIGCSNLKTLLENQLLEVNSFNAIEELGTFVMKGKSYEADDDCNDDIVMTMVLFSWYVKQDMFKDYTDSDISQSVYDRNREQLMDELTPLGFFPESHVAPQSTYEGGIKVTHGNSLEDWFAE